MIWQQIRVDIWRRRLKGDHFLVNQVLDLVLEIDTVFCIMSNSVGMISTSLLRSVESGIDIHGLGPNGVDVSGRRQSFEQLGSAFSQHGEASGGLLLKSWARGIIPALLGGNLLVTAGVWSRSLVIWMGALIC